MSDLLPRPGDPCPGFKAEPGRCWRMVYDRNLHAPHCRESPAWTGRWFSAKGDRWWRVWSCPITLMTWLDRDDSGSVGSVGCPLRLSQRDDPEG